MAKKVLGLDLGTNSIGWAVVEEDEKRILGAGTRIIPMSDDLLGDYERGNAVSQTKARTDYRSARRLRERYLLRRERLCRVLRILGYLPEHYAAQLDRYGKLPADAEPKLAWREGKDGKGEFLFKNSFEEMIEEFRQAQPQWMAEGHLVPYDWTIYYLRAKALTRPISKEELAWVLMQFNQKRGYNKLRGEEEDESKRNKREEYLRLKVVAVEDTGEKKEGKTWYNVRLENGMEYRRQSRYPLDWVGQTRDFIVTTNLNPDGTEKREKDDRVKTSMRAPGENDWGLLKLRTEQQLTQSHKTIGSFIFDSLLHNPKQKIIGQLVRTVDRSFYRDELLQILRKQKEFMPELRSDELYEQCLKELYASNEAYRASIARRDFVYLLADDILFYQRPLKSKKSLIANCPYERRKFVDKETGEEKEAPIKCIAKSHPLYQEFRLWQFLANLRIYKQGLREEDITHELLPNDKAWEDLYDWLRTCKSLKQEHLLKHLDKKNQATLRWNYVPDREYPMGETRATMLGGLAKAHIAPDFLTAEKELELWHIMYSVDGLDQYKKALLTYASRQLWDDQQKDDFVKAFGRLTLEKEKKYGAYSAKAIKRLLPLMRRGRYWQEEAIDAPTRARIEQMVNGESVEGIPANVQSKFVADSVDDFSGLPLWKACYVVYGRHSEPLTATRWESPADIDIYLASFRQHSLNNPIVEQVVTESLRVVRDVWQQYGRPDEIHIELGRDLKRTRAEREDYSQRNQANEQRNQRIRVLLEELMNPDAEVENVRPYSPSQQELLKIYEEGVMQSKEMSEEMRDIQVRLSARDKEKRPSHSEVMRYKLWLDQGYLSPYTGRVIPLGKLFTEAYQIEHVIPQSRYFDDSLSNKVICEAEVNQLKDRQLAHEFILRHHEEKVQLSLGGTVEILSVKEYEDLVGRLFAKNQAKKRKLMLDDIPEGFSNRQMNDSRYVSRLMMGLLSRIVREEKEGTVEAEATSKHVVPCTGGVTDRLKKDWGVNDVWNQLMLPRFERLDKLTGEKKYTTESRNGHRIPSVPLELKQGFSLKRIDHRHHAMDAIVIACATRSHVNLLNNEAASEKQKDIRYDLQRRLRTIEKYAGADGKMHERFGAFVAPWPTFAQDTLDTLSNIVVSFKQNLRVINKTTNLYQTIGADGKKMQTRQTRGDSWAIRKALHKDTVFGEVNLKLKKSTTLAKALQDPSAIADPELRSLVVGKLREKQALRYTDKQVKEFFARYFEKHSDEWPEVKDGKVEVYYHTSETPNHYYATRKSIEGFTEKDIDAVTDTGIQKILRAHLAAEGGDAEAAFSADGIERMNAHLAELNGGKQHQPIRKVRKYEKANKFAVGEKGNKRKKFVEAAKGTNLFFAIFTNAKGERDYASVPLILALRCQKQHEKHWREHMEETMKAEGLMPEEARLLYLLSPGDLVYVPYTEDKQGEIAIGHIYMVVSMSGKQLLCRPHSVASVILDKKEFESQNKMESTIDKEYQIKKVCQPLKVDRLGNIISIGND